MSPFDYAALLGRAAVGGRARIAFTARVQLKTEFESLRRSVEELGTLCAFLSAWAFGPQKAKASLDQ